MARAGKGGGKATAAKASAAPAPAAPTPAAITVTDDQLKRIVEGIMAKGGPRDEREQRDGREAPDMKKVYFARRPFGYGGKELDREQLLKLTGLANDAKLVDLKYIAEVPKGTKTFECRGCGATFLSMSARDAHGQKRHEPRPPAPTMEPQGADETDAEYADREAAFLADVQASEDRETETEERMLQDVAPLDLTKTRASREAGI